MRLYVSVDDFAFVKVIDPHCYLSKVVPGLVLIQSVLMVKQLVKIAIGHVLHDKVMMLLFRK